MIAEDASQDDSKLTSSSAAAAADEKIDTFEALFSELASMKETAGSLPPDQRKAYAAKVAQSFYEALGGSEDDDDEHEDDHV